MCSTGNVKHDWQEILLLATWGSQQNKIGITIIDRSQYLHTVYSFLHAKFRIWTNRLNLCLNLRPQYGHAWRGSLPHSTLMWRRNEWYSWYTLQHLGHTNKLLSCCALVSIPSTLWFLYLLGEIGDKTATSLLDVYSLSNSAETVKNNVSTIMSIDGFTSNFKSLN
jgi:hypothetical protein